jgi:hypothetical protein
MKLLNRTLSVNPNCYYMKQFKDQPSLTALTKRPHIKWMLRHGKLGIFTLTIGVLTFIALMILHSYYYQPSHEYIWAALISIPVTIFCLGGFSVFYEWYIRNTFTSAMRSAISSWDTGVTVFPTHLSAPDRVEVLNLAKKKVKLMSTTFKQYFVATRGEVERKIGEENVDFRFIIYSPDSNAVEEKAFEENTEVENFIDEIKSTCRWYLGPLKKKYVNNIEVRFCPFNTPFGVTIIDDVQMVLSLNIYGLVRSKNQTPCLIIENKYEPDSVFKQYDQSFDAIWNKLDDTIPASVKQYF